MKEELLARLSDLEKQYKKVESDRDSFLNQSEILHKKMLFLSGAYEEIKLLIKKYFPEEETPCEHEEK